MPFGNSNFLQALGWAVLNSLWQMAFLWVIFQVILSFKVNKPAYKSRLATISISIGFCWFLFTLFSFWFINPSAPKNFLFSISSFEATTSRTWNAELVLILPYASAAYLMLLIIPVFQFIRNYRFVQVIRTTGLSKCNVDIRIFVKNFAERMGIHKPVHIYISDLITSPVTVGFLKPIILMPMAAITHLSAKQVEAVLLHELSHIRRYDYLVNLWISFIRTILYFNPFVKLFTKTIEREREKSCDEMVIQFQYDPFGYASALLVLEKNNSKRQHMAIAASGQKNDLLHRIERILGMEKRNAPDLRKLGGLLAGLLCIIGLNALFFFSSPLIENNSLAFDQFTNPFYHFISDGKDKNISTTPLQMKEKQVQTQTAQKIKSPVKKKNEPFVEVNIIPKEHLVYSMPEAETGFIQVDERIRLEPRLKKYQEEQVKGTVAATKKVLENGQWKEVEKNVADAMTQLEKETLKEKYYNDLQKVNWKKLEDRLRLSYNDINWEKVNTQLNVAITNMTLDSIKLVYSVALNSLNHMENWMTENNCSSIPDTDLKLTEVISQKEKVQQQLKLINAIRQRKIIHL
jgi:bla regulator protein BlaR1